MYLLQNEKKKKEIKTKGKQNKNKANTKKQNRHTFTKNEEKKNIKKGRDDICCWHKLAKMKQEKILYILQNNYHI